MAQHFGINLVKGQNVVLSGLQKVIIGCGWDPDSSRSQYAFDLDVACAMLDSNRKMKSRSDFIYYGNKGSSCGAIIHIGDNLTGEGEGDDERLLIDFQKLPSWVECIPIVVCIYDAGTRRQNFGLIQKSFVRIIDITNERNTTTTGPLYQSTSYPNQEFLHYDITECKSTGSGLIFGELYKYQGEWKFKAIEKELLGGFNEVLTSYVQI